MGLSKSKDFKVRWFKDRDLQPYISGLNKTLYEEYNERIFKWEWLENPHSLGFVSIAVVESQENTPIAFNSFLPLKLRYSKEEFMIVQGCDGFVDADYRRSGLFQETIRFMAKELEGKGPEMLIGFNFSAATEAAKKAGSLISSSFQLWTLKSPKLSKDTRVSVERVTINDVFEIYKAWETSTDLIHVSKSRKYLEWRFLKAPMREYRFYKISGYGLVNYLVASLGYYEQGKRDLVLEDFSPALADPRILSSTIIEVEKDFGGADSTGLIANNSAQIARVAVSLGFSSEPRFDLIMKAISGIERKEEKLYRKGIELTNISDWHITDSDIY